MAADSVRSIKAGPGNAPIIRARRGWAIGEVSGAASLFLHGGVRPRLARQHRLDPRVVEEGHTQPCQSERESHLPVGGDLAVEGEALPAPGEADADGQR